MRTQTLLLKKINLNKKYSRLVWDIIDREEHALHHAVKEDLNALMINKNTYQPIYCSPQLDMGLNLWHKICHKWKVESTYADHTSIGLYFEITLSQ